MRRLDPLREFLRLGCCDSSRHDTRDLNLCASDFVPRQSKISKRFQEPLMIAASDRLRAWRSIGLWSSRLVEKWGDAYRVFDGHLKLRRSRVRASARTPDGAHWPLAPPGI